MSGFEVVGLLLALPPAFHAIIKSGRQLARQVNAINNPQAAFGDLSAFRNQDGRLYAQFQVARQICNDLSIDVTVRDQISNDFDDIQNMLLEAIKCVEKMENASKLSRFWIANRTRKALENSTQCLEKSVGQFSDTVQLISQLPTFPAPEWLSPEVFQPTANAEETFIADGVHIVQAHLALKRIKTDPKIGAFVREQRPFAIQDQKDIEDDTKRLAAALSAASPSDGILDIVGYRKDAQSTCFELIFDLRERYEFKGTLRSVMQETQPESLGQRINICSQLADAIFHIHKLGLVHKNINSGNIITTVDKQTRFNSSKAAPSHRLKIFLTNWHLVRKETSASLLIGQAHWLERMYQHPGRQVPRAEVAYSMAHDIYSLGVCMLELLLWKPLVIREAGKSLTISKELISEAAALKMIDQNLLSSSDPVVVAKSIKPREFQALLVALAYKRLPAAAGDRLTQLVIACLKVVENGFGASPVVQADSVETGLNYMAAVKDVLAQICV
ncbi:hypothetical protein K432DRAFT_188431 [Lepidopterella palustris CBS 459.81]|uniref:Protein kinase domain-containing protein n=1 Tax=Lepidopterella palustris CBS 459.81 TaxID=1314670 RepID=A0A8E2E010_9PEZI|nr:hypothetical protein K432DRAFT_188431 [Lepidopterella palustris CBS 459.81]